MIFFFVITVITLQVGAGIAYLIAGDMPHAIFWTGAAVINASTLFM